MNMNVTQLEEKWSPVLDHQDLGSISDKYRRSTLAVMLENQERALREERQNLMEAAPVSVTGDVAKYDPVLIGLVRRAMPQLIAYDICGVQPMTMPTGLVFALSARYTNAAGAEALFNEARNQSGKWTTNPGDLNPTVPTSPVNSTNGVADWDSTATDFNVSEGITTSDAEGMTPASMSFKIDKFSIEATSRALRAEYSIELQQDLKAVHGLDAESELSNILSNEIIAEINREVVRKIYKIAKNGAELTSTAGTFDLDVDANGRWSVERFKGLIFQIEREANRIAQTTRRGRGNFILCSADVASALAMSGKLDYTPALKTDLNPDDANTTFAGTLNGKYKVYIDPYMANGSLDQFCMVGYKGSSPFDAGMFYCPYVPLQLLRAVDPNTFQPKIGFKTRYGLLGHPMANGVIDGTNETNAKALAAKSNNYYRLFKVSNLA